jgi:hypothetical protein
MATLKRSRLSSADAVGRVLTADPARSRSSSCQLRHHRAVLLDKHIRLGREAKTGKKNVEKWWREAVAKRIPE